MIDELSRIVEQLTDAQVDEVEQEISDVDHALRQPINFHLVASAIKTGRESGMIENDDDELQIMESVLTVAIICKQEPPPIWGLCAMSARPISTVGGKDE